MSQWREIRTLAPPPQMFGAPMVSHVNATTTSIYWNRPIPKEHEGDVVGFRVALNGTEIPDLVPAEKTSLTLKNLKPFHFYLIQVAACVDKPVADPYMFYRDVYTDVNDTFVDKVSVLCSAYSKPAAVQTDEAPPGNVTHLKAVPLSSSAIDIHWRKPDKPNGFIIEYIVYRIAPGGKNSSILYCDDCYSYTDYELEPDNTYQYAVAVRNGVGFANSSFVKATTPPSSPEGVFAPNLRVMTATTVLVLWEKPVKSNGKIIRYNVFINKDTLGYSGSNETHAYVGDLLPNTEYEFEVEACTSAGCTRSMAKKCQTLEAAPQDLDSPVLYPLADSSGQHSGVRIQWKEPARPNGAIKFYTVERRFVGERKMSDGNVKPFVGPVVQVYNGTKTEAIDKASNELLPFSLYEYKVTAINSIGSVSTPWKYGRAFTEQSTPEGVRLPEILSVSADTITMRLVPPEHSNGYITAYHVYVNGELAERITTSGLAQIKGLKPASAYLIHADVCTAVGCTSSPPAGIKTPDAAPIGLDAPIVNVGNLSYIYISWDPPKVPNGNITKRSVILSTECLIPDKIHRQPRNPLCHPSSRILPPESDNLSELVVTDLLPFCQYTVAVRMVNSYGYSAISPNTTFATPWDEPQFLKIPKVVEETTGRIKIYWNDSFALNSPLVHYTLAINEQTVYEGQSLATSVFVEKDVQSFTLAIAVVTEAGFAESPPSDFKLSSALVSGSPHIQPHHHRQKQVNSTDIKLKMADNGIFEQPWFVIGIALIGLVCGAGLIVCACRRCMIENEKRRQLIDEADQIGAFSPSPNVVTKACHGRSNTNLEQRSIAAISNYSSSRYIRQRAPLTAERNSMKNKHPKRRAPKGPPTQSVASEFRSLQRSPNREIPLSPVCNSDFGAFYHQHSSIVEHEAPSIENLHIEVSGPGNRPDFSGAPSVAVESNSFQPTWQVSKLGAQHNEQSDTDSDMNYEIPLR